MCSHPAKLLRMRNRLDSDATYWSPVNVLCDRVRDDALFTGDGYCGNDGERIHYESFSKRCPEQIASALTPPHLPRLHDLPPRLVIGHGGKQGMRTLATQNSWEGNNLGGRS